MSEVRDAIEILAPEVNREEVIAELENRIQQRRLQAQAEGWDYDHLVKGQAEDLSGSGRFGPDLCYDLYQAGRSADAIGVSLSLKESRVPVLGRLFIRLRRELHNLSVYYVNILARQQAVFNRAVLKILSQWIDELDESPQQVATLEAELSSLRQRIDALEALLVTRE
jgi:hypothetical protein